MIHLEGVTQRHADGTISVDTLDLVIPPERVTALVGPPGSGKTAALRMINGMVRPTKGRVTINGADIMALQFSELRRGIGFVTADGLFLNHTVARNIATVLLLLGWDRANAFERAESLLEVVGVDPILATAFPRQLTPPQRSRVALARALAADPPILLLDEPFAQVAVGERSKLQDDFLRLQADMSKTVVFVTDDVEEALKIGDQVAIMRPGGYLAQVAEPHYLLTHPADDYVADYLGRDRGYRSMAFSHSDRLVLHQEPSVQLGDDLSGLADPWVLVTDEQHRPLGWVEPARVNGPARPDVLHRGGSVARADGSLRAALDAALSSPTGRGVLVDESGALLGTVLAREVIAAIEGQSRIKPRLDHGAGTLLERVQRR